ncbi:MAG: LCP family protein [Actinomycetota bacterium]|nr:LCP family protein [Actinomycetota bacterium]
MAKVVVATFVVLAMVTGLSVVFFYRHLNDNLTVLDISDLVKDRPEKKKSNLPKEPLNILVMGSDDRDGAGNNIDGLTGGGARSDTTLLFHLSADRQNAYGISIPRDTLVDRPDCIGEDGETLPGASDVMWNEAFGVGGPACTITQFEDVTGVYVDHFVVVDFNGFQDMVDAIDGVEVCIPEDIEDPAHGINIPAGTREIEGKEALNYVRARYTLGDGSDIGRVKRQQAFIAAMANKVVSNGVLTRFDRLVPFLNAATESLVVDKNMGNVFKIGKIGLSFKNIGLDNIKFITAPFQYSTEQPGRVEFLPEAEALWQRVIDDEPLSRRLTDGVITAGDAPDGSESPDESPSGTPGDGPSESAAPEIDEQTAAEREAAGLCA